MYFDKELMFVDAKALQDANSGVLGQKIDFGAGGQGKGRQSYVAVCCGSDTTATGSPDISFKLESSPTEDFLTSKDIALSFGPLKKTDLAEGKCVFAPFPLVVDRFACLAHAVAGAALSSRGAAC